MTGNLTALPVGRPSVLAAWAFSFCLHAATLVAFAISPHPQLDGESLDPETAAHLRDREVHREARAIVDVELPAQLDVMAPPQSPLRPELGAPPTPSPLAMASPSSATNAFGLPAPARPASLEELSGQIDAGRYGSLAVLRSVIDGHAPPAGWDGWDAPMGSRDNAWSRLDEGATAADAGLGLGPVHPGLFAFDHPGFGPRPGVPGPRTSDGEPCTCASGGITIAPTTASGAAAPAPRLADVTKASANGAAGGVSAESVASSEGAAFDRVAASGLASMRACFSRNEEGSRPGGSVLVHFVIDQTGVVETVRVEGPSDAGSASCIARVFGSLSFPSAHQKVLGTYLVTLSEGRIRVPRSCSGGGVGARCVCS